MTIKVNLYPWLSEASGGRDAINVKGRTIGECLDQIDAQIPGIKEKLINEGGNVKSYVLIFLNGENAFPNELSKTVKDGDELGFILLVDGG